MAVLHYLLRRGTADKGGIDSRISLFMLAIGIISAIASGFAYNMVRSLKKKEDTMVVVLHFQLIGVVAGLAFSIFNWQTPQGIEWVYLLLVGICTQLGQVNLTKALQRGKAADISIMNYLGIIYALHIRMVLAFQRTIPMVNHSRNYIGANRCWSQLPLPANDHGRNCRGRINYHGRMKTNGTHISQEFFAAE